MTSVDPHVTIDCSRLVERASAESLDLSMALKKTPSSGDRKPPFTLGPYEVRTLVGAGGMGEVFRAWDPRLRREVAIKVLPEEVANSPERLRRFEQEARAAGSLNHPNVLSIFD